MKINGLKLTNVKILPLPVFHFCNALHFIYPNDDKKNPQLEMENAVGCGHEYPRF